MRHVGDLTAIKGARPKRGLYRRGGKRAFDLIVVLAMAPIMLPLVAIIWLITVLDGGAGFYAQPRIGRGGRVFNCWKIRTMVPDAEAALARLMDADPDIRREWREKQKLENDPRITRWGKALRRTSLDELPQLWNVVVGQMSLFGPRPFTPDQQGLYDACGTSAAYYDLRPGISGLWQVEQRNEGSFADRQVFDDRYDAELSLWTDLKIAAATVRVVFAGTGR